MASDDDDDGASRRSSSPLRSPDAPDRPEPLEALRPAAAVRRHHDRARLGRARRPDRRQRQRQVDAAPRVRRRRAARRGRADRASRPARRLRAAGGRVRARRDVRRDDCRCDRSARRRARPHDARISAAGPRRLSRPVTRDQGAERRLAQAARDRPAARERPRPDADGRADEPPRSRGHRVARGPDRRGELRDADRQPRSTVPRRVGQPDHRSQPQLSRRLSLDQRHVQRLRREARAVHGRPAEPAAGGGERREARDRVAPPRREGAHDEGEGPHRAGARDDRRAGRPQNAERGTGGEQDRVRRFGPDKRAS